MPAGVQLRVCIMSRPGGAWLHSVPRRVPGMCPLCRGSQLCGKSTGVRAACQLEPVMHVGPQGPVVPALEPL